MARTATVDETHVEKSRLVYICATRSFAPAKKILMVSIENRDRTRLRQ